MSAPRAGFTVAELAAVLLVIGVGAAVAVPALRTPREEGAGAAAAALREVYAGARGASALRGVPVAVEVDAAGAFAMYAELADGARDTLREGRLPLGPDGVVRGGTEGAARARFTPLGRARADRAEVVAGGASAVVEVDPWTGGTGDARP